MDQSIIDLYTDRSASQHRWPPPRSAPGSTHFVQPPPEKGPPFHAGQMDRVQSRPIPPTLKLQPGHTGSQVGPQLPVDQHMPAPWSTAVIPPWSTSLRPLSDIRELTEPSLMEISNRCAAPIRHGSLSRKGSVKRYSSISRHGSLKRTTSKSSLRRGRSLDKSTIRPVISRQEEMIQPPHYPAFIIADAFDPSSSITESYPQTRPATNYTTHMRQTSTGRQARPTMPAVPPRGEGYTIPNRGRAHSPVKGIARRSSNLKDAQTRPVPRRTFHRPLGFPNIDIVEFPCHRHPRFSVELHLSASLFVGGGTIEGQVKALVEDIERIRHRRQLAIARCSVDLLGVEELSGSKRDVFINLATELIEHENPPPRHMVDSLKQISPMDPF